jgi:hypothetical protein
VRYVVLLTALAPEISGEQTPQEYPVRADLAPALAGQLDLQTVVSGTGITVYANTAWIPERASVPRGTPVANGTSDPGALSGAAGAAIVKGAVPVLPGAAASRSYRGRVPAGTVLTALAPAGSWSLVGADGTVARRRPSFGWAGSYQVASAGPATLRFGGGVVAPGVWVYSIIVWAVAVALLLGRRVGGILGPVRRRWHRAGQVPAGAGPAGSDAPAGSDDPTSPSTAEGPVAVTDGAPS